MKHQTPRQLIAKVLILAIAFLYMASLLVQTVLAPCNPIPLVYDADAQCNPSDYARGSTQR